jgi:hypothetical protein
MHFDLKPPNLWQTNFASLGQGIQQRGSIRRRRGDKQQTRQFATDHFPPFLLSLRSSNEQMPPFSSLGSVFSSKAPDAPGTRHLGFVSPTLVDEGGRMVEMNCISCSFPTTPWSLEELRLQDYKSSNLWKEPPSGFSGENGLYSQLSIESRNKL